MTMKFIKVTADQCNAQGTTSGRVARVEFYINSDLIGAIRNGEVLLKGGKILNLGGDYYTNIRLGAGVKVAD